MIRTNKQQLSVNANKIKAKEYKNPNRLKSIAKGMLIGGGVGLLAKGGLKQYLRKLGAYSADADISKMFDDSINRLNLINLNTVGGGIVGGTFVYGRNKKKYEKQENNKKLNELASESYKNRSRQQRLRDVFR